MARDLVPLKVKIGKWGAEAFGDHKPGHNKYPDFDMLQPVRNSGLSWSKYVDIYGTGWMYDKAAGHDDEDPESPAGTWIGILCVPKDFADEAAFRFPDTCSKMTEEELEAFYDSRIGAYLPEVNVNDSVLAYYDAVDRAGISMSNADRQKKLKALDPDDPEPGVRRNHRKTWAQLKAKKGLRIVQ